MDLLMQEWWTLKQNEYKLRFEYPTDEEKKLLRVINKEAQGKVRGRRKAVRAQRDQLLQAAEKGEVDVDQLILELENIKRSSGKK